MYTQLKQRAQRALSQSNRNSRYSNYPIGNYPIGNTIPYSLQNKIYPQPVSHHPSLYRPPLTSRDTNLPIQKQKQLHFLLQQQIERQKETAIQIQHSYQREITRLASLNQQLQNRTQKLQSQLQSLQSENAILTDQNNNTRQKINQFPKFDLSTIQKVQELNRIKNKINSELIQQKNTLAGVRKNLNEQKQQQYQSKKLILQQVKRNHHQKQNIKRSQQKQARYSMLHNQDKLDEIKALQGQLYQNSLRQLQSTFRNMISQQAISLNHQKINIIPTNDLVLKINLYKQDSQNLQRLHYKYQQAILLLEKNIARKEREFSNQSQIYNSLIIYSDQMDRKLNQHINKARNELNNLQVGDNDRIREIQINIRKQQSIRYRLQTSFQKLHFLLETTISKSIYTDFNEFKKSHIMSQ